MTFDFRSLNKPGLTTIIAGSRHIEDFLFLQRCIEQLPWRITEVVSGQAKGVDRMGAAWARQRRIPVKPFPALWYPDGPSGGLDRKAGFKRNVVMADYAKPEGALLAIWDGVSKGTAHMILVASKRGLRVEVRRYVGDGLDC